VTEQKPTLDVFWRKGDEKMAQLGSANREAAGARFQGGALAPDKSRFEKPEIGSVGEMAVYAHVGWRLQKIFPLPPGSSEPDDIGILLRKIKAKLDIPQTDERSGIEGFASEELGRGRAL
jgi:hypothetical protein